MAQRTRFLDVPDKHIDHSWSEFSRWVGEFFAPPEKIVRSRMFDALQSKDKVVSHFMFL